MRLPTEIYDLIVLYVEIDESNEIQQRIQSSPSMMRDYREQARPRLANLRLVNKDFYRSVSARLFRCLRVRIDNPARSSVLRLEKISKSKYVEYVHEVDFRFWSLPQADQEYVKDITGLIRSCLPRFNNLRALTLRRMISDWSSNMDSCFFASSIADMFRDISLPNFKELTMDLLLVHTVGGYSQPSSFFQSQILPIMSIISNENLRCLDLHVHLYPKDSGDHQELGNVPLTHGTYKSFIYQTVKHATKLQSLSIAQNYYLNLDSVDFSPCLPHLRFLNLTSVVVSAERLLSFFIVSVDHFGTSQMRRIEFRMVRLSAGTWYSVLLGMIRLLPHLVGFKSKHIGYSVIGPTAYLIPKRACAMSAEKPCNIETVEAKDVAALGHLQRLVNGNRIKAGLYPFTKDEFEYLEEPPLELMQ